MKKYFLFIAILLFTQSLFAQQLDSNYYIFPEFTRGIVYYKEGAAVRHDINYNLLYHQMQFFNEKDKKVALTDFTKIEYISVGLRRFLPLEVDFAEIITETDEVALVLKRFTKVSGASKAKVSKLFDTDTPIPEDVTFKPDSIYYLLRLVKPEGVKKGIFKGLSLSQDRVVVANYNGFLKVYSNHKDEIIAYVADEELDLKNHDDIIRLMEFCNSLD